MEFSAPGQHLGQHRADFRKKLPDRIISSWLPAAVAVYGSLWLNGMASCCVVRVAAMEKRELSKIEFDLIDEALRALLNSGPAPTVAAKVADLRTMFRDAYTGWLEIEDEAA